MVSDDSASVGRDGVRTPAVRAGPGHGAGRGGWAALRGGARRTGDLVKAGSLEFERVLFFSDAVIAIAITLLVVDLRVPFSSTIRSAHLLRESVPEMIGFGIGFAVIGVFWRGHHYVFRHIVAMDGVLIRLNLLFLGTIAFLPYPTALLSSAQGQAASTVFYAACVAAAGLTEAAAWLYALRVPGLVSPDLPRGQRRGIALRILIAPFVFVVSIPIALVAPDPAEFVWIMIWVLNVAISRLGRRAEGSTPRDDTPGRT